MLYVGPLLLIVTCALCFAAPAVAQELPKVDPDSPAGVEYQLPLDRAREEAAGEGKGAPGGAEGAPLFGSGIKKVKSPRAGGDPDGSDSAAGKRSSGERSDGEVRTAKTVPATAEGGSSASVPLIAAAVLILGGALGLGLRRGLGPTRGS